MNISLAKRILGGLKLSGVKTLCLCPGGRNAPFIELLAQNQEFESVSFYDERSAGFFALGRAQRDRSPVALITTSGTAVSELLSPVIEAHYSHTPLVVVSGDRPKRLRGTGAPQTIEQAHLFQAYVEKSWDLEHQAPEKFSWSQQKPIHINVCFDEPLVDEKIFQWNTGVKAPTPIPMDSAFPGSRDQALGDQSLGSQSLFQNPRGDQSPFSHGGAGSPLGVYEKALVVVGQLGPLEQKNLETQLSALEVPIFLEATSGLRGSELLRDKILLGGEAMVSRLLRTEKLSHVLRFGDVPLGRYWRDLDSLDIPTLSFSNKAWGGTEKAQAFKCDLTSLSFTPQSCPPWDWSQWQKEGRDHFKAITQLIHDYPLSEVACFHHLAHRIPPSQSLYLGNSLPIREWDLVDQKSRSILCNRGANGIDGQLSSALGAFKPHSHNWVVLGDLTTLYDFSGFWITPYLREQQISVNLMVINNKGGQIFSRLSPNPLFRNVHDLNFESIATHWGWKYKQLREQSLKTFYEDQEALTGLHLMEILPCEQQSLRFWQELESWV